MDKIKIYKLAVKKWGIAPQLITAMEEASEFIKAVTKMIRYKEFEPINVVNPKIVSENMFNLIDEIADITIMIGQINQHYRLDLAVRDQIGIKLMGIAKRLTL